MRYDELAFLNLQLAGMLRSGIPLEGSLQQLCASMKAGAFKDQLRSLESDLANGVPLKEALAKRELPDLYRRMLVVGAEGNDLPGVLTLLADHYQRVNTLGARLKGLMVYPAIVMLASLALSCFLAVFFRAFSQEIPQIIGNSWGAQAVVGRGMVVMVWTPVIVLGLTALTALLAMGLPPFRRWLRWHLPGFKEAALAQLASAMRLMLKAGTNLADALGLLAALEHKSPAGSDVAHWRQRLAEGQPRFQAMAGGSKVVPPLFFWLVGSAGENLADGFERAAEIYQSRARYRAEMLLYAALPVSILFLGVMLLSQAYPVLRLFSQFGSIMDAVGL